MPKKNAFAELVAELEQLETMAKSFPRDDDDDDDDEDEKIRAAADGDGDGASDGDGGGAGTDDDEYDEMAKSLGVKPIEIVGEDGKTQVAYDGLEVLKAMHGRVKALESDGSDSEMLKGMKLMGGAIGTLMKQLKSQGSMIKSMQEQLVALGTQGSGRKTFLSVLEKSLSGHGDDADGDGVKATEILAKAQAAAGKGLISAVEVAHVERMVNSGQMPSDEVMSKIEQA